MLKKTIRRLGALAMVLAMAVSVFAVNASAVEETISATGIEKMQKELQVSNGTISETFAFTATYKGKSNDTTCDNPYTQIAITSWTPRGKNLAHGWSRRIYP